MLYASEYVSMSSAVQYDTVQLNRIEWMLMQLMMKLSGKDDALKLFDSHDSTVPDPSVSGPLDTEVVGKVIGSVSKSKQRRMRMAQNKERMWSRLQQRVEGDRDVCEGSPQDVFLASEGAADGEGTPSAYTLDCEPTSKIFGADSSAMLSAMFQKLVDMEAKVDDVSTIAEEANFTACRAKAVAEGVDNTCSDACNLILDCDAVGGGPDAAANDGSAESERHGTDAPEPLSQISDSKKTPEDLKWLAKLKGAPKEDVVMNLLIDKTYKYADFTTALDTIERYFEKDLENVAGFLGMKFGFKVADWSDCRTQIVSAAHALGVEPSVQVSVGDALVLLRRTGSEATARGGDRSRQLTNQLVRPKRKKRFK